MENSYKQKEQKQAGYGFLNEPKQIVIASSQDYQKFFSDTQDKHQETLSQIHTKLKEKGNFIIHEPNQYQHEHQANEFNFSIKVEPRCSNWEIVELQCKLGIYQKNILIFNTNQNMTGQLRMLQHGTMAETYLSRNQIEKIAIKSINLEGKDRQIHQQKFIMGLKEHFIASMMSALEIGPKIKSYLGFDIILTGNYLQFAMELCEPLMQFQMNFIKDSKIILNKMHLLKLVHLDIKLQNMMLSPSLHKLIFIDFGLSDLIEQKLGQKTLTNFRGSLAYCGNQMRKCIKHKNYADLYLNDVQCLQNSFEWLKKIKTKQKIIQIEEDHKVQALINTHDQKSKELEIYISNFRVILIKGLFVKEDFSELRLVLDQLGLNKPISIQAQKQVQQIFQFIIYLRYSKNIQNFVNEYFKLQKNNDTSYIKLQDHFFKKAAFYLVQTEETIQQPKLKMFKSKYQHLHLCNFQDQNIMQKKKFQKILIQQKYSETNEQYFAIYLKYISFCDNVYRTTLQQKYLVSLNFIKNHHKKFVTDAEVQKLFPNFMKLEKNDYPFITYKLELVIKCIKICVVVIVKNIENQSYSHLMMNMVKQTILLKIQFFKYSTQFLQLLIACQNQPIKKIRNCLMFCFQFLPSYSKGKPNIWFDKKQKQSAFSNFGVYQYAQLIQITSPKIMQIKEQIEQSSQMSSQKSNFLLYFIKTSFLLFNFFKKDIQIKNIQNKLCQLFLQVNHIFRTCKGFLSLQQRQIFTDTIFMIYQEIIHFLIYEKSLIYANNFYSFILKQFSQEHKFYLKRNKHKVIKIDFVRISISLNYGNLLSTEQLIQAFNKKTGCAQISSFFFFVQKMAITMNKKNQKQIKRLIQFFYTLDFDHENQMQYIFKFFNNLNLLGTRIWKTQIGQSYETILKSSKYFVDKITENYSRQQKIIFRYFNNVFYMMYGFRELIKLNKEFYKDNKSFLHKIHKRIQSMYLFLRKTCHLCHIIYLHYLYERVFRQQKNLLSVIIFLKTLNLQQLQFFSYNSPLQNSLLNVKTLLLPDYQKRKQNQKKLSILYYNSNQQKQMAYYHLNVSVHSIIYLIKFQKIKEATKMLLKISLVLKKNPSKIHAQSYMFLIAIIFQGKSCLSCSQICDTINLIPMIQIITLNLMHNQINYIQHSYFSVVLGYCICYKNNYNQTNIIKKVLIFIAKSFKYINYSTKEALIKFYYQITLKFNNNFPYSKRRQSRTYFIKKKWIFEQRQVKISYDQLRIFFLRKIKKQTKIRKVWQLQSLKKVQKKIKNFQSNGKGKCNNILNYIISFKQFQQFYKTGLSDLSVLQKRQICLKIDGYLDKVLLYLQSKQDKVTKVNK